MSNNNISISFFNQNLKKEKKRGKKGGINLSIIMGEKQKTKILIRHSTIVIDIIQQQKPDIVRKILNKL